MVARAVAAPLVAAIVAVLALTGLHGGVFQGFRQRASDALFPTGATSSHIAIVGIDGRSLDDLHRPWPWPRQLQAQLVSDLTADGASVIVEDLVYDPAEPGDSALAASMKRSGHVVLASSAGVRPDPDGLLLEATAITGPVSDLARQAYAVGHASVTPDPSDGVVRSLPLVVEDATGHFIPSLALAALMAEQGGDQAITLRPNGVSVGSMFIPTGDRHALTISFSRGIIDPNHIISAADVLSGHVDHAALAGKIVFVGVTDPTLGDTRLIPPDKQSGVPGVVLHAAALNTILTGSYIHDASSVDIALVVFLLALLIGLAFLYLRLMFAAPALGIVVVGYALWVFHRFSRGDVEDLVYPGIGVVIAVVAAITVRYLTESRQRRRVAALFASYVPDSVAQQLIRDVLVDEVVAGKRVQITAFFCDLRGFTPLAATLEAVHVRRLLDLYYEHVCARILAHGGTIMPFVGDEVFAVFGAPVPIDDHRDRAYATAFAVQAESNDLDRQLAEAGLPPVRFGIGLHAGEVVAAHVGPKGRRQYSVVGDPVNVGSRLCGQAGAGEVVMSEAVSQGVNDPSRLVDMGRLELKGVTGGVHCFRSRPRDAAAMPS
jgi:adenylate cyclase